MRILFSWDGNKWRLLVLVIAICSVACRLSDFQPVEIGAEDMCAYCRMAISEKRYAAQFLDDEGQASKFDDVACMMKYLRAKKDQGRIARYYVVDFDSHQWIAASLAFFIQSPRLKTPMNGSIIAFEHKSRAEQAAAEFEGKLVNFGELRD
jgi:copper chaperone NosL